MQRLARHPKINIQIGFCLVSGFALYREFALYDALAAGGYLEGLIGHLGLAAAVIVDGGQMTYHIVLLADGHIVVGKAVQKLAALALVTEREIKFFVSLLAD